MTQKTMIGNAFSSPRNDAFPAGLRVLVVDDDPTWLKILEKMLKKCSYEVTTCGLARDALNLLRERKDKYDIVISDVNMPDMDGFKLLEHVGLEMDLPVIMMSVDGETSRVMKGVQHGACDYLLKPIRMKELRNIWQHVFRKKIHEVRDIEILEGIESMRMPRIGLEHFEDGHILYAEDLTSVKKRKDVENRHDDKDIESPSTKRTRVVWSVDLHQKFVKAVNQIGFDKVGPKKILDLMNMPWLTRENVASHLQKYRLYLSRLQKENDSKNSIGGMKHSDSPLSDSAGSLNTQNSINMQQQCDAPNSRCGFSDNNIFVENSELRSRESKTKVVVSQNTAKSRSLTVDVPDPQKPGSSQMGYGHSFVSPNSERTLTVFDSNFPMQYSVCEIPQIQMKREPQSLHSADGLRQLPLPGQQNQIQASYQLPAPSIISGSAITEIAAGCPVNIKRLNNGYGNNVNHVSSTGSAVDSSHDQINTYEPNNQPFDPIPSSKSSVKNHGFDPNCLSNLESMEKSANPGMSPLATLNDDNQVCWVQGDCYAMNVGLQTVEFPQDYSSGLIADIPASLYDAVRFDFESSRYDSTEYSLIEQGLYIA